MSAPDWRNGLIHSKLAQEPTFLPGCVQQELISTTRPGTMIGEPAQHDGRTQ